MQIEKILKKLKRGEDVERVFREEKWQDFEEFVAYILEAHGFKTKLRIRFEKGKYEIDVLGERQNLILGVECKKWKGKTQSIAKLREAGEKHAKKCVRISKILNKRIIPVIVTLLDSGIEKESDVIFVPVFKLNYFLLNLYDFI